MLLRHLTRRYPFAPLPVLFICLNSIGAPSGSGSCILDTAVAFPLTASLYYPGEEAQDVKLVQVMVASAMRVLIGWPDDSSSAS